MFGLYQQIRRAWNGSPALVDGRKAVNRATYVTLFSVKLVTHVVQKGQGNALNAFAHDSACHTQLQRACCSEQDTCPNYRPKKKEVE